jgi:hypothetical protein
MENGRVVAVSKVAADLGVARSADVTCQVHRQTAGISNRLATRFAAQLCERQVAVPGDGGSRQFANLSRIDVSCGRKSRCIGRCLQNGVAKIRRHDRQRQTAIVTREFCEQALVHRQIGTRRGIPHQFAPG